MVEVKKKMAAMGKEVFMRARAGNINISFPAEEEAQDWEDHLVSGLKEYGLRVNEAFFHN